MSTRAGWAGDQRGQGLRWEQPGVSREGWRGLAAEGGGWKGRAVPRGGGLGAMTMHHRGQIPVPLGPGQRPVTLASRRPLGPHVQQGRD